MAEIAAGLRRAARNTEGTLGVFVRFAGDPDVAARALRAAVDAAEASDDEVDRATPLELQETSKGPAVVLTDADPADMLPVIERLAERLDAAGLSAATLTVLPTTNPWGRDPERAITAIKAWMVLRGQRPDGWAGAIGWPLDRPYWQSTTDDVDTALVELVDWAVSLPARGAVAAVSSTIDTFVPVPLTDALAFMRRTQQRLTLMSVNDLMVTAGNQFRSVDLNVRKGLVTASEGVRNGASFDWDPTAEHMRELLITAGGWCGYGHLVRGAGTTSTSTTNPDGDRQIGNPWASRSKDWAELVTSGGFFDAYPVMRLPASDRAQVEAQWQVSSLEQGGILAQHPSQGAWLSQPRIDPDELDAARRSLGTALIDRSSERLNG